MLLVCIPSSMEETFEKVKKIIEESEPGFTVKEARAKTVEEDEPNPTTIH
jgi:hypothetical protein